MEALDFLRERKRMCNYYSHCEGCTLKEVNCALDPTDSDNDFEIVITTVEQWSKKHTRKTRQSVFLEQYPEAALDNDGVIDMCPSRVSAEYRRKVDLCVCVGNCPNCCREFWLEEVE